MKNMRTLWQSTWGKWWLTHWASLLRCIWSISEYNLTTRDSPKWTLESGPCSRERRGSAPAKQKPKHNPCRPVGRNRKNDHVTLCLARATWLVGILRVSQNDRCKMWNGIVYHKSDRKTCVAYPQLTAIRVYLQTNRISTLRVVPAFLPDWYIFRTEIRILFKDGPNVTPFIHTLLYEIAPLRQRITQFRKHPYNWPVLGFVVGI